MTTRAARGAAALLALGLAVLLGCVSGCTGGEPTPAPTSSAPPSRATPVPAPASGACHRLDYAQAVAPTTEDAPVPCDGEHTAETFLVGRLDTMAGGHLLAVDSQRVQAQVARTCPRRLGDFVGGSDEERRLSMLRAVWFTPSVEAAEAGADWFRCDVIAVAGAQKLAPLRRSLRGVLDTDAGARWAMCGTARPGAATFTRVPCGQPHRWRALRTVDLGTEAYPGEPTAREAGQEVCRDAAREVAADALNFEWGYEWPTAEQWNAGQPYGICWAPA